MLSEINKDGQTPLIIAKENSFKDILNYFETSKDDETNQKIETDLLELIEADEKKKVKKTKKKKNEKNIDDDIIGSSEYQESLKIVPKVKKEEAPVVIKEEIIPQRSSWDEEVDNYYSDKDEKTYYPDKSEKSYYNKTYYEKQTYDKNQGYNYDDYTYPSKYGHNSRDYRNFNNNYNYENSYYKKEFKNVPKQLHLT